MPDWVGSLPRKLIRWVCVAGVAWAFFLADIVGVPVEDTRAGIILAFVASVYGFREWGKVKGTAEQIEITAKSGR